jgi:hypothetical protein
MDLPGHGGSSDAPDPEAGYCMADMLKRRLRF